MSKCVVITCKNTAKGGEANRNQISFFKFPKFGDPRRKLWEKAAGNGFIAHDGSRMCSIHFAKDAYSLKTNLLNIQGSKRALSDAAVPTLSLPEPPEKPSARDDRLGVRKRRALVEASLIKHSEQAKRSTELEMIKKWRHKDTQTLDLPEQRHTKEIRELKQQLQKAHTENRQKTTELDKLESQLRRYQVLFTPGIVKRIETGTSCDLMEEDKSFCIALESRGPKAYQFMRLSGFPFPHTGSLRD